MDHFDAIIIGAGVVGLAVARELALQDLSVLVLEGATGIGMETSSRNSEVIHAGLYYEPGSLKARLCVEGRHALYAYCAARGIPHRRCGKILTASNEAELASVEALAAQGRCNGADDLEMITGHQARAMEPALKTVGAMWSPSTGIIDSHALMLALQADAENAGALFAFRTPFVGAECAGGVFIVQCGGDEPVEVGCRILVNAAGLHASIVARKITGLSAKDIPETRYCKGNYFMSSGRVPFSQLIYPAPHAHGLGVHLTLDMAGQARFGPDTEWIDTLDYHVRQDRQHEFEEAVRHYWPDLPRGSLVPGYSGIRPKLTEPGKPSADFEIHGAEVHGISGLINLFGIESPGLTSSLAIAREVASRL
ncbi:NAD(P)/FAD-dependent oxidoreductase [Microvirga sp. G4-2]|uniref:NAD(P)/FAD-dependent oxidoreductase n=1 Tax=Microvirga sp. G4-2 TaxID=3434467 RepID=UPI0040447B12